MPCAVIGWQHGGLFADAGALYTRIWGSGAMAVYVPAGVHRSSASPWPLLDRLRRMMHSAESPARAEPSVDIRLETNGTLFHDGQRLLLRVALRLSPSAPPVGLYAGVLLPGDLHVALFRAPNVLASPIPVSELHELVPLTPPESGLAGPIVLLDDRISSAVPTGEYRIFAALATPSRSRSPDADDFLAADLRTIRVVR